MIKQKKKPGRKPWQPPALTEVEALAAKGLNEKQIALALGISFVTLLKQKRKNAKFLEAVERGKALGIKAVCNFLYKSAQEGNVTAQIFFLKCRAGWKEINHVEIQKVEEKPIKEMTDAELQAIIDGSSAAATS